MPGSIERARLGFENILARHSAGPMPEAAVPAPVPVPRRLKPVR